MDEVHPNKLVKEDSDNDSEVENLKDERTFEDAKRVKKQADGENGDDASLEENDEGREVEDSELLDGLEDGTEEIELTHARLRTLRGLDFSRFKDSLQKLCFRQNLLPTLTPRPLPDEDPETRIAPLECLENIEELDFYDNRIAHVNGIRGLNKLRVLDYSFNLIKHLPSVDSPDSLSQYKNLDTLFLVQNSIKHIHGLDGLGQNLRSLELGGNKIKSLEGLDSLVNLKELFIGKNKISSMKGLENLKNLRVLSIQSNRIAKIEGLENLEDLEELYISHNGITDLTGLENNKNLTIIDIAGNRLTSIEGIQNFPRLTDFWANDNQIASSPDPLDLLQPLKELETVYLEGNPIQKDFGVNYRRKIILALPQISQLDAAMIKA